MRFLAQPPAHDLTYSDVFLVPSRSDVASRFDASLTPGDGTPARLPALPASVFASTTGARHDA